MDDCIFCKIINKEVPSKIVYEDGQLLAFEDINPQAPVHILLIPKKHYASLNEISEDEQVVLSRCLWQARRIAIEKGIGTRGYRIVLNTAPESGQEVLHIHFHLLGGRRMTWPPG